VRARRLLALALALGAVGCGEEAIVAPAPLGAGPALPDLDQATPRELEVTRGADGWRLGFWSGAFNGGTAPLVVVGRRAAGDEPRMRADQLVGGERRRGVGELRYVRSADHAHWHLLGFERYTLTPAGGGRAVRDRKTGFCLGDRYPAVDEGAATAAFTTRCGLGREDLRRLRQGISVGWGDDYAPTLEGQYVRVDGLPDGEYVLAHRVDPGGRLRESDEGNNAASVRLRLRRRLGRPGVSVLQRCPDSARC
jgi:hypothetical protein